MKGQRNLSKRWRIYHTLFALYAKIDENVGRHYLDIKTYDRIQKLYPPDDGDMSVDEEE